MKTGLAFLLIVLLSACTITVRPLARAHRRVYHPTKHVRADKHPTTRPSQLVVDSDWLIQYRDLEKEHGDYKISDDPKVQSAGGGKYRVTPAMLRHFRDLSQSPVQSPTPK